MNGGPIADSYATGKVAGHDRTGGLVGSNTYSEATIQNCYCAGEVAGGANTGGLAGYNEGFIIASFWDIETTQQAGSAGGVGKTTVEMKMAATFLVWGICGHGATWTIREGIDYPRLAWEGTAGQVIGAVELSDLLRGTGSPDDPYLIDSAEELSLIGLLPCHWRDHFKLTADIDLSTLKGASFNSIGSERTPFAGVFDGNGHTITGLPLIHAKRDEPSSWDYAGSVYSWIEETDVGLFGYIRGPDAAVRNLGLIAPAVDAESGQNVGAACGLPVGRGYHWVLL